MLHPLIDASFNKPDSLKLLQTCIHS